MKFALIRRMLLISLFVAPIGASSQNAEQNSIQALAKKIRDSRKSLASFQAFGTKSQGGSYFEPVALKPGENSRTDYSKKYYVYIGFEGIDGRLSTRKFSEEDEKKPERFTVAYYSTLDSKTTCYGNAGLHLVRPLHGGRYVNELGGTSIAFPVQTIGFWVSEEKKWPDELLETGRYRIVGEKVNEKFRREIEIVGKTEDNRDVRFTLAPDFGYRVIKSVTEVANVRYETTLGELIQTNSIWCPKHFTRIVTPKDGSAPSSETYEFEKILVNKSGENDIRFIARTGDHNHELPSDQHSYTLGDGSRKYVVRTEDEQSPSYFLKGWLYIGGLSTLLTVVLLSYIKWRMKQRSKSA